MEERILFEERLWYPNWPFLLLLGFVYLVFLVEALLAPTDRTGWIIVILAPPVAVLFWAAVFKVAYHRIFTRVGERTLQLGRDRIVPRGADLFNAGSNPTLRGLVMMPGAKTAVYLRVDPPVKKTGVFVVATRRADAFLAAVQSGGRAHAGESLSMRG